MYVLKFTIMFTFRRYKFVYHTIEGIPGSSGNERV